MNTSIINDSRGYGCVSLAWIDLTNNENWNIIRKIYLHAADEGGTTFRGFRRGING